MCRDVALLAVISLSFLLSSASSADDAPAKGASAVLAAMAEGIGDLTFASPEWVAAAQEALTAATTRHADGLKGLGKFTLCEVGHNAPAYLHSGASLAWHVTFKGSAVEVHTGELPADECDLKIQADHSILSNLARIQYHGKDPELVAAARARLKKLSRREIDGKMPEHKVLRAVLRSVHDTMAIRTMPRLVFMTPEWVSSARHIVQPGPGCRSTLMGSGTSSSRSPRSSPTRPATLFPMDRTVASGCAATTDTSPSAQARCRRTSSQPMASPRGPPSPVRSLWTYAAVMARASCKGRDRLNESSKNV